MCVTLPRAFLMICVFMAERGSWQSIMKNGNFNPASGVKSSSHFLQSHLHEQTAIFLQGEKSSSNLHKIHSIEMKKVA
jgi:hypothetical protein